MDDVYRAFVTHVANQRKIPYEEVSWAIPLFYRVTSIAAAVVVCCLWILSP